MTRKIVVFERADAFQDGSQLFLGSFPQANADNLDELFPTDVISKVAYAFYKLVSWIHIKSFEADLKSLSINPFLCYSLDSSTIRMSHNSYFLKWFVKVVKIVYFISI